MGLAQPFTPEFYTVGCPVLVPALFAGTGRGFRCSSVTARLMASRYGSPMPWGLRRFQQARCLHFITFSCYRRAPLVATPQAGRIFEQTLERVRQWYGLYVTGYVIMPEHVHLLVSEPERGRLSVALQMLKQVTSRQLKIPGPRPSGRRVTTISIFGVNTSRQRSWTTCI